MIQVKKNYGLTNLADDIFYIGACICTLGLVWLFRIIITKAIKCALENQQ